MLLTIVSSYGSQLMAKWQFWSITHDPWDSASKIIYVAASP